MSVSFVRKDSSSDGAVLRRVKIGLRWDETPGGEEQVDCDASVILCKNGKLVDFKTDVVFYNNLHHVSGAISHQGDNYCGGEAGDDDETIYIDLDRLGTEYDRIVVVVTIYNSSDKQLDFSLIHGAFVTISDIINGNEMCKLDISGRFAEKSAIIVGELLKGPDQQWRFSPIEEGTEDHGILEISKRFM